jgi:hypothetical protein
MTNIRTTDPVQLIATIARAESVGFKCDVNSTLWSGLVRSWGTDYAPSALRTDASDARLFLGRMA